MICITARFICAIIKSFVLAFSFTTQSVAQTDYSKAHIFIDYNTVLGKVNRNILGNNIVAYTKKFYGGLYRNRGAGIWDPDRNAPNPVFLNAAKDAGTSVLRWPGGKNARYFDWKTSVGPISDRPKQRFGLPEFLRVCEEIGAEPVITLSSKILAEDAADLVEYLNAPIDWGNLNGGINWAKVRAGDGHSESWRVRWFEFGNESFQLNDLNADVYVRNYLHVQRRMKSIDSRIQLGAVLEDSDNVDNGWNKRVIESLASRVDFFVIHPYVVKLNAKAAESFSKNDVALATLSADHDMEWRLHAYRQAIDRYAGARNIPIAVTEYNGLFVQDRPIPYRHTLLNALHNADNLRIFLNPRLDIVFAAYWQFVNSYWGMVRGGLKGNDPVVKQPMQYVFELYNEYLGTDLLKADVVSPSYEFKGRIGISPRIGSPFTGSSKTIIKKVPSDWSRRLFIDGSQTQDNGIIRVEFSGEKIVDYYHAYKKIKVKPNTLYKITAKVRTVDLVGGKVGIAVQDARGWKYDFYQPRNTPVTGTSDGWQDVSVYFRTSSDCHNIMVLARNSPHSKLRGVAEFGSVTVQEIDSNAGSVQSLEVVASKEEGGKLYLLVLNKNIFVGIDTEIRLQNTKTDYTVLTDKQLKGESIFSTNLSGLGKEGVGVHSIRVINKGYNVFFVRFPPYSLTAIAFDITGVPSGQAEK